MAFLYPWGNTQQLNLDWILQKIKELETGGSGGGASLDEVANALISASYAVQAYDRSDIVFRDGKLYRANQAIPAPGEAWTPAHWDEILLGDTVSNLVQYVAALSNDQIVNASSVTGTHTSDALDTLKNAIDGFTVDSDSVSNESQVTGVTVSDALDTLDGAITSEATTRANADTTLQNAIISYAKPNLLDNWYFVGGGSQQSGKELPINQRGQTVYNSTGQDYTIDRWRLNASGQTLTLNNDGLTIASGTIVGQIPAFNRALVGATVTWTVLTEDGLATQTGIVPDSGATAFAVINGVNCFLYVDATSVFFAMENASGGNKKIKAAKLEIGNIQTLAHQESGTWLLNELPNYQQELAKCQRYFVKYSTLDCMGILTSGSLSYYVDILLPVPMAKTPSIAIDNMVIRTPSGYSSRTPSGTPTAPDTIQNIEIINNELRFVDRLTTSAGDTNNIMLYYTMNNLTITADF